MGNEHTFAMIQSRLFDSPNVSGGPQVLVSAGGSVTFDRYYLEPGFADSAFKEIQATAAWEQRDIKMFGRSIPLPRLTAWYGNPDAAYKYSGIVNKPCRWTPVLSEIRDRLQIDTKVEFNSVLLNLYRSGEDSLSWHSDDEPELGSEPVIASISLGESRRFELRSRLTKEIVRVDLEHGSLLLMSGEAQSVWEHQVPKTKSAVGPRINLTFRVVQTVPRKKRVLSKSRK